MQYLKEINYKERSKKNTGVLYILEDHLTGFEKHTHTAHTIYKSYIYLIKIVMMTYNQDKQGWFIRKVLQLFISFLQDCQNLIVWVEFEG